MAANRDFPEIAFVRVLTAGGPYSVGTILSIAFMTPGVGRLAAHDGSTDLARDGETSLVPETISARVIRAAGPYATGASLTLSFVDPSIARIHATDTPDDRRSDRNAATAVKSVPQVSGDRVPVQSGAGAFAFRHEPERGTSEATTPAPVTSDAPGVAEPAIEAGEAMVLRRPPAHAAPAEAPSASEEHSGSTQTGTRETVAPQASASPKLSPETVTPHSPDVRSPAADFGRQPTVAKPENKADVDDRHGLTTTVSFSPPGPSHRGETVAPETIASLIAAVKPSDVPAARRGERTGVRVRLDWNRDRVRRFVQVVDKLFTVNRLGWYRHVFAMRLLVPDVVVCGEAQSDVEALRHLHALRAASIETLGRPLLAAFMPNFTVNEDWLDSLDRPGASRALAGLRDAILPLATEDPLAATELETSWTIAAIGKRELATANASSVESLLPLFIPYASPVDDLTEKLAGYRSSLIDIFGQTALSASAIRLNLMAEPNHTLDDRLWQLARAVNETFGGLAVA